VIATASHNPRAAAPAAVADAARAAGLEATTAPSIAEALEQARGCARPDDLICVTGSLYAVAEAREALGLAETPVFERSLLYN
jgi:dihydrofolate synthase/folylpolyglutamate synthase